MKLPLFPCFAALPLCVAACSHSSPPPATEESSQTQTTSAAMTRPREESTETTFRAREVHAAPDAAAADTEALQQWAHRYPDAAMLLSEWIHAHPSTAARLAAWEQREPEKMRVLVDWAAGHPYDSLAVFSLTRPGWETFAQIEGDDPDGVRSFVQWARGGPTAARELTAHKAGLAYADGHLGEIATVRSAALEDAARRAAEPWTPVVPSRISRAPVTTIPSTPAEITPPEQTDRAQPAKPPPAINPAEEPLPGP
jgi:hypothetical protein